MTSFLAGLLRSLFPALVLGFAVIVLGGAGLYGLVSGNLLTAGVLAVTGVMAVVVLFGMLAVQIENHALLRRIAGALDLLPGAEQEADHWPGEEAQPGQMRQQEIGREMVRAAPGRREPVVTLRPQASYEPI